jgi:hypothetical protein
MSHKIFKNKYPNELFFSHLQHFAHKMDKYYLVNHEYYKKGIYNEKLHVFLDELKPYYHVSKQKYVDKKMTYNSFTTILRQICKHNNIHFTSQIKYDKSDYDIFYYIYHGSSTE